MFIKKMFTDQIESGYDRIFRKYQIDIPELGPLGPRSFLLRLDEMLRDRVLGNTIPADFNGKFNAIGCQGVGGMFAVPEDKVQVQKDVAKWAERKGPALTFLLGDNFYHTGITDVNEDRFHSAFYNIYHGPCFVALGNHDYNIQSHYLDYIYPGGKIQHPTVSSLERAMLQVLHTYTSGITNPRWLMPNRYYCLYSRNCNCCFIVIDSNSFLWDIDQKQWLDILYRFIPNGVIKVLLGHHPMLTNGKRRYQHNDIGKYSKVFQGAQKEGTLNDKLYEYLNKSRGYKFHLIIAAHDHLMAVNRVPLEGGEVMLQVTSGGGAGSLEDRKTVSKNFYPNSFVEVTFGFAAFDLANRKYALFDQNGRELISRVFGEDFEGIRKTWKPDTANCSKCGAKFVKVPLMDSVKKGQLSAPVLRHHCRLCGEVFCGNCCPKRTLVSINLRDEYCCDNCYAQHGGVLWEPDTGKRCKICNAEFGFLNRRHHCRNCGALVCSKCASEVALSPKMKEMGMTKPERICWRCLDADKGLTHHRIE